MLLLLSLQLLLLLLCVVGDSSICGMGGWRRARLLHTTERGEGNGQFLILETRKKCPDLLKVYYVL